MKLLEFPHIKVLNNNNFFSIASRVLPLEYVQQLLNNQPIAHTYINEMEFSASFQIIVYFVPHIHHE